MRSVRRLVPTNSLSEVKASLRKYRKAKTSSNSDDFVQLIDKAMRNLQKIRIWYKAQTDSFEEVMRVVTPLNWQIKHEGNVYVTSYNGHHDIRTYRLDRITKVQEIYIPGYSGGDYANMYDYYDNLLEPGG